MFISSERGGRGVDVECERVARSGVIGKAREKRLSAIQLARLYLSRLATAARDGRVRARVRSRTRGVRARCRARPHDASLPR